MEIFYIDGGVSCNFAINIADEIGKKILGIYLSTSNTNFNSDKKMNILEYFFRIVNVPITDRDNIKINNSSEKCDIITINCPNIKLFNFDLNSKLKLELFSQGYNIAKKIKI